MPSREDRQDRGFTLLEVLLVVSLLALLVQVTAVNLGAFVPGWRIRAESKRLATRLSFLASEARLQGSTFVLEFDLDRERIRTLLPPDFSKALINQKTPPMLRTDWDYLDEPLVLESIKLGTSGNEKTTGKVKIPFRPMGTTVDAIIILADPQQERIRKYLRLHGLDAKVEVSDEELDLPEVTDNDFI